MKLTLSGHPDWDRADPLNRGVSRVELVGTSAGTMVRRIEYRCAATGREFVFLTNELTLAPGLIALLYKLRWDIEKAFDETKNRFWERKSWASSPTAKTTHARLVCVAYNLTLLLEDKLESEEGIRNEPEHRRKAKERAKISDRVAQQGGSFCPPGLKSCSG